AVEQIVGEFRFIGGHPMSGSEKTGFAAAKDDLFENAYYILTPTQKSRAEDLVKLTELVAQMGAIPMTLKAITHDHATAAISHLPHVVAAGLVNFVQQEETKDGLLERLAAGGFRDITRIASSNPLMWLQICESNRVALGEQLLKFSAQLKRFGKYLAHGDNKAVFNYLNDAKNFRDNMPAKGMGLLPRSFELVLDVPDRVGIIGEIAMLLAQNAVNIQNIYVANSRENLGGVLLVSVPDEDSLNRATEILTTHGFLVN
ncbi:MAG: prephenate dehydrogenase/arogenate dehydrogenase family protein, partial [Hyphomonadaceae bacterium]|nr:prephenate dehydrogenase/arogenate dehydrogenase family protein [Clostridia bacterium]